MNYFIHDERDLSPAYVASCRKFLKELKATSRKRQALNTIKQYKKYRIVLSYDVQKIFEVNAKDEDAAMDKAKDWKGDLESDDWEYRDLIESTEI